MKKDYLSWTQYNLWKTSKTQYIKKYFEGIETYVTKEMNFGKQIANEIELGIYFPPVACLEFEKRIDAEINGVPCMGYLDSANAALTAFVEYKTGKKEWTQKRVDNHGQLYFYALIIKAITGKIPEDVKLCWIQTENDGKGGIKLTDKENQIFEAKLNPIMLDWMEDDINKVWHEINATYEMWYKSTQGEIFDTLDLDLLEYSEIEKEIKQLEARKDELKEIVLSYMKENTAPLIKNEYGTWSLTSRSSYEYPESIKNAEDLVKKAKKDYEKNATPSITTSLKYVGPKEPK